MRIIMDMQKPEDLPNYQGDLFKTLSGYKMTGQPLCFNEKNRDNLQRTAFTVLRKYRNEKFKEGFGTESKLYRPQLSKR